MTLQQCRYLAEAARQHSISKAAASLCVTQPSLSKAILELEAELGVTVFQRTNRGVALTSDGAELLSYAKTLLAQEEALKCRFCRRTADRVKLCVSSQHFGFAAAAAAGMINSLNGRDYELTLREGKAAEVVEDAASGRSALGVLSVSELNQGLFERLFAAKALAFTPLLSLRERVFIRKEHPLAGRPAISLAELRPYPYFTFRQNDVPLNFAEGFVDENAAARVVYLGDRGTMNNLLASTDGWNLGTGCLVKGFMNPNIISVPLEERKELQVGYVKKAGLQLSKEAATFLAYLEKELKDSAPRQG